MRMLILFVLSNFSFSCTTQCLSALTQTCSLQKQQYCTACFDNNVKGSNHLKLIVNHQMMACRKFIFIYMFTVVHERLVLSQLGLCSGDDLSACKAAMCNGYQSSANVHGIAALRQCLKYVNNNITT